MDSTRTRASPCPGPESPWRTAFCPIDGQLSVPMGRIFGHGSGSLGAGAPLDSIRISVRPGTNELITAYPD